MPDLDLAIESQHRPPRMEAIRRDPVRHQSCVALVRARPSVQCGGGIKRQAGVIAGHEPCGVVAAVGAGVSEKEFRSLPVIPSSMPILIKFRHCCCRPPGLSPRRRAALGRVRPSLPPR